MEGLKRKRRCEIECKEHIFAVQSLKGNSSKYDIKLLFCPKYQRDPLPPEHTYPEYNNDEKFYTSAFILGVDRRVLLKNQQQELMDHQKQIRDSLEKHNQLVFPRPNSKHSLCSVCKEHYKNYYYHIASEQHRERIGLSLYNIHIKELCSRYQHLWEGAQEKADAEAEIRSQEEQLRRAQMAEMAVQQEIEEDEEDDDDELLDVQRGSKYPNEDEEQDEDDGEEANYQAKPAKKHCKSVFRDDDTIPFTAKTSKRVAPEGRTYTSDYLRKKFQFNAANQDHAQREREERRYERERDKLKTQRDNPDRCKDFIKISQKEGDTFIIMKASFAILPQHPPPQPVFVWKRLTERFRIKETPLDKADGSLDKFQKENKKYQIGYEDKLGVREPEEREAEALKPFYNYYYPPYAPVPEYKHDFADQSRKNMDQNQPQRNFAFGNQRPPPYYPPYVYPPMFDPYIRANSHSLEKENKNNGKDIDYPPMPYACPYPPFTPPPMQTPEITASSKQSNIIGNNNINFSFPMHMYPPYGPGRYPPYLDYHYQPNRDNSANQAQNGHQNNHLPAKNQQHTLSQVYPSVDGQSFRCLPPYPPDPHHGYQLPHHDGPVAHSEP